MNNRTRQTAWRGKRYELDQCGRLRVIAKATDDKGSHEPTP